MDHNNEIKTVIERAKKQLTQFYNGENWVTDNFSKRILSLDADKALKQVNGHTHSVAQLVSHINAWRNFVVQKLTGNDQYDIEDNSLADWPESTDWTGICKESDLCHQSLLAAIDNFPAERWNSIVPGRNYSFTYLIMGLIEHDYYHYGQIGSVLAAMKKSNEVSV